MWQIDMRNLNTNTSCYDSIVEAMLKTFGFEYQYFSLKKFSPNHLTVDKNGGMIVKRGTDNNNILLDIFDIKSTFLFKEDIDDLHDVIKYNITYSPIGMFVDAINCEWTFFYKKKRINHFVLIIDIDEKNKIYKCIDSYYSTNGIIEITYSDSDKIFEKIVLFEFGANETNLLNIPVCLKKYVNIPDQSAFDNERKNMINYISHLAVENIGSEDTIYVSNLLLKLKWISEDKLDFLHALQYHDSKFEKLMFGELYNTLESIANQVNLLKSVLIRYVFTRKLNTEKIIGYINDIYFSNYQICIAINRIIK